MEESNKKRLPCFCNQILKNSLCRREPQSSIEKQRNLPFLYGDLTERKMAYSTGKTGE